MNSSKNLSSGRKMCRNSSSPGSCCSVSLSTNNLSINHGIPGPIGCMGMCQRMQTSQANSLKKPDTYSETPPNLTNLSINEHLLEVDRRQSWGSFTHLNNHNNNHNQPNHCLHQCPIHTHIHNRNNHLQRPYLNTKLQLNTSNNLKLQQANKRHSLIPQYHQSSVNNLTKTGCGPAVINRCFNNSNNSNKQVKTDEGTGLLVSSKKEFELSNLLRIKSNKLGSSAPNLCSSMVSGN